MVRIYDKEIDCVRCKRYLKRHGPFCNKCWNIVKPIKRTRIIDLYNDKRLGTNNIYYKSGANNSHILD